MSEVITDTSPIQYLHQTNFLNLLPALYGQIIMPQAVADELAEGRSQGVLLPDPDSLSWITLRQVSEPILVPDLPNIGKGEREVLSLALMMPDALVILDDALARNYARQLDLAFTGTLGVLLKAKQLGHVESIAPILDQLNALNFRVAQSTAAAVLKLANEGN
ncbi:MAG: DUF3368 domain-containing protein [Drouetiella hepatica Uher 2000/2452]|uniref:DUF3368 domain-containing protein n=1 Tax=Drouetiella hepatica Uher 2000/2452 TaxID=904376 RepID=A0A951QDH8_9CYAN|nr:DUF3368 domain-containing protein [Drouetiella hepatica Uher 2000/2452]